MATKMSDVSYSAELTKTDHDPLQAVERKLVIFTLVFGAGLLTLLGLFAQG
jgi:hypothetical protein